MKAKHRDFSSGKLKLRALKVAGRLEGVIDTTNCVMQYSILYT